MDKNRDTSSVLYGVSAAIDAIADHLGDSKDFSGDGVILEILAERIANIGDVVYQNEETVGEDDEHVQMLREIIEHDAEAAESVCQILKSLRNDLAKRGRLN